MTFLYRYLYIFRNYYYYYHYYFHDNVFHFYQATKRHVNYKVLCEVRTAQITWFDDLDTRSRMDGKLTDLDTPC